jgi:NAD+ kinase
MASTPGSTPPSGKPVRVAAVVTHGKKDAIGPAFARLRQVARDTGVELVFPSEEREKHGLGANGDGTERADIAVVLGGDGTMLRALGRFLGTAIPVVGVNFGRVGFLTTIEGDDLEAGLRRVFAGDYGVLELPTLDVQAADARWHAVNDMVATSATLGRMVELEWSVGGENLGVQPCDGLICATPSGSTAYNISNGGPVLVWGLEAMVVTFVAPHSVSSRPVVVPPSLELGVVNRTSDVPVQVLVDGHPVVQLGANEVVRVRIGEQRTLLASLPEATFFQRYRETFTPAR